MSNDFWKKIEQRDEILREIAIVIDTWDDIFSDFDPRPLSERTVSGDFIDELKKRYIEKRSGDFCITLYAPLVLKNKESEKIVTIRLKQHFRQRFLQMKKGMMVIRIQGMVFALVGICALGFLTLATYFKWFHDLIIQILGIFLMPLGWFGVWEGFSKIIDTSPVVLQDKQLFEKLSNATYLFKYIEEVKVTGKVEDLG
ncbi:MAG: hypothetical protein HQL25_00305 [Candidatus Omnitrophica bacterium]|nr:hypothetical protein [Candidatus Omnitrophota bacterium]